MKVIDILTSADENKNVQIISTKTGHIVAEYNGKDSIPEELNDCEVLQLASVDHTIVVYI